MNPSTMQVIGTVIFALAVVHTFLVKPIENFAHHLPEDSMSRKFFHFLAEVEAVFGIWAAILIFIYSFVEGFAKYDEHHKLIGGALHYLEQQNFTEPAFVFVIMCMAGTRPVIILAEKMIKFMANLMPLPKKMSFYCSALIFGPILGSFITEPAAMTVTSLILLNNFYSKTMTDRFKYATLGLLFVNISIGGTLTHFAAPPVLMVAGKWGWNMTHMFTHFGYKALFAVFISTFSIAALFKNELKGELEKGENKDTRPATPIWVTLVHLVFLALVVLTAHHMSFFLALFIFFLGFSYVTGKFQDKIKLKESLLVGFFLGGLVTLGSLQGWWLKEVLSKMSDIVLYFGATLLTGVTDNAALTYLGSLVDLSHSAKYYLVSGAVIGGGLTVIANAPNPAGYGILKESFGEKGIGPVGLLVAAIFPTIVASIFFYFLPSL